MAPISKNSLLIVFGASFITLLSIVISQNSDKFMPTHIIKVSGTIDRIGIDGRTVFMLKDNNTRFYIESNTKVSLTKPGDTVEFTVTNKDNKIEKEELVNRNSFSNISLGSM
jgi:hypothetical protein